MVQQTSAGSPAVFVGRSNELATARDLLDCAASGRATLMLVSGPPGIGKTGLLNQAAGVATERGFSAVWGRCWEAGGAPAYWPWSQALRSALNTAAAESKSTQPAQLAAILPEFAEDPSSGSEGDPAAARFRLFSTVAETLQRLSDQKPMLVILDDLHLADEPSLLLLRFIVANGSGKLAFLGAFRDPDTEAVPGWQAPAALLDLARQPEVTTVHLKGLAQVEVGDFIAASTGRDLEQNVVHQIYEETEGNPLFLGELVRLLESEGRLSAGAAVDILSTPLPPTISEAISRRLRHVSAECLRVLKLASILGRDFDRRPLAILCGEPVDALEPRLHEAARARLTLETGVPGGQLRFAHALIRDALYQSIPVSQRNTLHLAAGNALEKVYAATNDEHLAELAFHYVSSGEAARRDKGIHYAQRAAQRAVERLAFEEGVRLYKLALAAQQELAPADLETEGELLLSLGDAQARSGDTPAAQRSFLAAADLARRLASPSILARAALGYGGRLVWATPRGDPNLIPLLREALNVADDDALRCRVLARLSGALREELDMSERDELSQQAVEIARKLGDPLCLAYALSARYPAVWGPDNLEERFAVGTELLAVGRQVGDRERVFHGHTQRLYVELERGEMSAAREDVAGASRIARELSQPSQLWLVGAIEAELAIFEGRLTDAERLAYRAHALGLRASRSSADIAFSMQLLVLRREQERLEEVADLIQATVDAYAATYPVLFAVEVLARTELGDIEEARALLDSLFADRFASLPRNDEWLPAVTLLAEAIAQLGDAEATAEWLYTATRPYAERNVLGNPELLYGSHSRALGPLALTLGRIDAAVSHFEQALTDNRRWGGDLWAAHSRLGLAEALIMRGAGSDNERAKDLLRQAGAEAAALPSTRIQGEANRLLGRLDQVVPRPSTAEVLPTTAGGVFRREGDHWHIEFAGRSIRLRDTRGLRYLSQLLAQPGRSTHALDVAGGQAGVPGSAQPGDQDLTAGRLGAPGEPIIDTAARSAYKTRLEELDAEISEAEEWNDPERRARAAEEKDFLVRELTAAFGLGGAPRQTTDPGERARQSVTKAVKSTIQRIARDHPELGRSPAGDGAHGDLFQLHAGSASADKLVHRVTPAFGRARQQHRLIGL
jgi:tetratricopeptide (TPR) repeat protein